MNSVTMRLTLANRLQDISSFLTQLPEAYLHWQPDQRWTIAEELFHLIQANGGTARLLSSSLERLRETDRPSRSYEALVREYREKYAVIPARGPQGIQPEAVSEMDKATLSEQWQACSQALQHAATDWNEDRWDKFTVWKHPLLGPLTVQEMLYFTAFHNQHHAGILKEKYQKLVSS